MFITNKATAGELLSQLITRGGSKPNSKDGFKGKAHNVDLCPAFESRVEAILTSFSRHRASAQDIQGFRDNGADILFRFEDEAGGMNAVALQVKSYSEIEADIKRRKEEASMVSVLKSQRTDAQSKHRVSKFYILLCGDSDKHRDVVRKVRAEFTSLDDVSILTPEQAWAFYNLEDSEIAAYCTRVLCKGDYVLKQVDEEFAEASDEYRRIVLGTVVATLEGREAFRLDELTAFAANSDLNDFSESFESSFEEATQQLMFERYIDTDDGEMFTCSPDEYPAVCALYFDLRVRHRLTGHEAFKYLSLLTCDHS